MTRWYKPNYLTVFLITEQNLSCFKNQINSISFETVQKFKWTVIILKQLCYFS